MIRSEYRIWLDEIEGRKPRLPTDRLLLVLVVGLCALGVLGFYFGGVQ